MVIDRRLDYIRGYSGHALNLIEAEPRYSIIQFV